ncbi:hypothetical protein NP511_01230 [Natrinema thermotolerans]|uniref:Uncharacterized protein n=1 Tax=Natrinema thermotolerans TaxID=121872 RepID=A0AAF0PAS0_9EURY|nr:hypothetical protein [Natrinema thermotolerans]ELZ08169.1 hypothetical protein C478_19147 [Natrinema thermotolerans DSM 11552]QCC60597.1 hypothetical protein DVR14_18935 [Natrinema thermotolerans]WMT07641.1 hypothetical protein NP511_19945 [Natrinema thermotolerans]WMT08273.1 hypothetical protein NP511_01230 [Natrinema thermotolerans]
MTDGRLSRLRRRLDAAVRERLEGVRWWYALRFGGAPRCAECGDEAAWIAETEGEPRCFKHIPSEGMAAIRDVRPADCFTDWSEDHGDA